MFDTFFTMNTAIAQEVAAKGGQPSMLEMLAMPVGFLFIMYFLIIRPQQKKSRDHVNLLKDLKSGDEVITSGGIIGRIKSVAESFVVLDVASNTSIKVTKNHIASFTEVAAKTKQS